MPFFEGEVMGMVEFYELGVPFTLANAYIVCMSQFKRGNAFGCANGFTFHKSEIKSFSILKVPHSLRT